MANEIEKAPTQCRRLVDHKFLVDRHALQFPGKSNKDSLPSSPLSRCLLYGLCATHMAHTSNNPPHDNFPDFNFLLPHTPSVQGGDGVLEHVVIDI